uniref:Uncharacterized protein n=1 Tax=Oryza meridionalis TaxID=40149 RepID=A0A0E0E1K9_9ORYZ
MRRRAGSRSTLPLPSNPIGNGGSMMRKKGGGLIETATNAACSKSDVDRLMELPPKMISKAFRCMWRFWLPAKICFPAQ